MKAEIIRNGNPTSRKWNPKPTIYKASKGHNLPNDVDRIFIELNLRKVKCLFFPIYHSYSSFEGYYFSHVRNFLDAFSSTCDQFLVVGYSNAKFSKETLFNFLDRHNAANIIHKVCFRSLHIPSCVDLLITSWPQCFQNTMLIPQVYHIL